MHEKTCIALAAAVLSLALLGGNPFLAPRSVARAPGMFALRALPAAADPSSTSALPSRAGLPIVDRAPSGREPTAAPDETTNGPSIAARLGEDPDANASAAAHGDH